MIKRIMIVLVLVVSGLIGQDVVLNIERTGHGEIVLTYPVHVDTSTGEIYAESFVPDMNKLYNANLLDLLIEYRKSVKPDTVFDSYRINFTLDSLQHPCTKMTPVIKSNISFEGFIDWLELKLKDGEQ